MSDIASFLSGKVLFITGATGFLAKGLLAKILLDARDVQRIYLLIRADGENSVEQRLEREVLQANALARVREMHGARFNDLMREKVVAVGGDLTQDKLGIDANRYAQLTREVDIVINSAASVVFDEEIDQALQLNTLGPGRLVEFARACRDAVFLHVSTAYVNGLRTGRVPEELISPDQAVAQIIKGFHKSYKLESEIDSILAFTRQVIKESGSPELHAEFRTAIARRNNGKLITEHRLKRELESLRNRWVKRRLVDEGTRRARELGWHDTYTFTKAMGEQIIAKSRGDIPTIIVRPSIIESSLIDPVSGWLDGLKVADPLIAHYSKGRLPDFPADPDIVLDLIPVDIVANAILAALPGARQTKEIQVYQVATGSENPLKLGEMFDLMHDYFRKYPMQNRRGQPIRVTRWTYPTPERFRRYYQLRYRMPLRAMRWMIKTFSALPWSPRLKQKVSVLEATLDRVLALTEIYSPYMHHDCRFGTENTRRLYEAMGPEDRKRFNFDVGRIEWQEYIQDIHIPALKRHVMKEAGSPSSRADTRNLSPQAL